MAGVYCHEPLDDPKEQIRVLELSPAAAFGDAIHCRLRTIAAPELNAGNSMHFTAASDHATSAGAEIDDASAWTSEETTDRECHGNGALARTATETRFGYEAVSYAWGNTLLTHEALIHQHRLAITANLDIALRYLRHVDRPRWLWIDGICIDQVNDHEKGVQVQMLRRIFNGATRVLIWLGADTPNELCSPSPRRAFWTQEEDCDHDRELSASQMVLLPWFERLWTMVELFFTSADRRIFGWRGYWTTSLSTIDPNRFRPPRGDGLRLAARFSKYETLSKADSEIMLIDLLLHAKFCRTSDNRDRVFALASLVPDVMSGLCFPDYTLTVDAVYQRMTVALLNLDSSKLRVYPRGQQLQGLPSWCMDFSAIMNICEYFRGQPDLGQNYVFPSPDVFVAAQHNRSTGQRVMHDPIKGLIKVQGAVFDRFVFSLRMKSFPRATLRSEEYTRTAEVARLWVRRWLEGILPFRVKVTDGLQTRHGKDGANSLLRNGLFWKILTGNIWGVRRAPKWRAHALSTETEEGEGQANAAIDYGTLERRFVDVVGNCEGPKSMLAAHCAASLSHFDLGSLILIAVKLADKTLFVTESGFFGNLRTCRADVQPGDLLAILMVEPYPVILRPHPDGTHELVVAYTYAPGIVQQFTEHLESEKPQRKETAELWLR